MKLNIFALLAPVAIAATLTASASAAVPALDARIIESSPVSVDVAYRASRNTTVRGPNGGVAHSRTTVQGHRGVHGASVHTSRSVRVIR